MGQHQYVQEPVSPSGVAAYTLSADPVTYGHLNIIERMSRVFPKCVVGIGRNPLKSYLFSEQERLSMLREALMYLPQVEVKSFTGMAVDFAREHDAQVMIKGVRSAADLEYEQTMHQIGVSQDQGIDTHVMFSEPRFHHVSSSAVKGIQKEHGFIQALVPPVVKAALEERISGQLFIGLTGDISSGKSTLAAQLTEAGIKRGIAVHNADLDVLGHHLLSGEGVAPAMHQRITGQIIRAFGADVCENGQIDRKKLASVLFNDHEKLEIFNKLIEQPIMVMLRKSLAGKKGIILLNSALLAERSALSFCNYRTVLCEVEDAEQYRRLKQREYSDEHIRSRLSAQWRGDKKAQVIEAEIRRHYFGRLIRANQYGNADALLEALLSGFGKPTGVS